MKPNYKKIKKQVKRRITQQTSAKRKRKNQTKTKQNKANEQTN